MIRSQLSVESAWALARALSFVAVRVFLEGGKTRKQRLNAELKKRGDAEGKNAEVERYGEAGHPIS